MYSNTILNFLYTQNRCLLCGNFLVTKSGINLQICKDCLTILNKSLIGADIKRCKKCSRPLLSEDAYCMTCRERNYFFLSNYSLFNYSEYIKELIYQYKFNDQKMLADLLAFLLSNYIQSHKLEGTVVPVPSGKTSMKRRGWDQMELIAENLEKQYSLDVLKCLKRTGNKSQKKLKLDERIHNLEGMIKIRKKIKNLPENVVIIDDIFTTGSTLNQCSIVLGNAGVKHILTLTIALD